MPTLPQLPVYLSKRLKGTNESSKSRIEPAEGKSGKLTDKDPDAKRNIKHTILYQTKSNFEQKKCIL